MSYAVWHHLPFTDEVVWPVFQRSLKRYQDETGRVDPDKNLFPLTFLPFEFSEAPGLTIRRATADDYTTILATLVERSDLSFGLSSAYIWDTLNQKNSWCMMWEWRGTPIQYENYYLCPEHAFLGYDVHFARARPHWFWREAERPVWQALQQAGVETVFARIRVDRPDWVEVLKREYGAVEVGQRGGTVLRYTLSDAPFKGWPPRKTAGSGWVYAGSDVTVCEMLDVDMEWVKTAMAGALGSGPEVSRAYLTLEEQWCLDRSTVLLSFCHRALIGAFSLRLRRDATVSAHTCFWAGDPDVRWRIAYRGVCEWARKVGYQTLTSMVPKEDWDRPTLRRALQHARARVVAKRQFQVPMVEVTHDLVAICAEPATAWESCVGHPVLPAFEDIP